MKSAEGVHPRQPWGVGVRRDGGRARRLGLASALAAISACTADLPPAHQPYRRPIPVSVRLEREGVRDTVRLRRWRTIDSLVASESGDSLVKLYMESIDASPSEGRTYMNATRCEIDRIMTRVGGVAGLIVVHRVADSLFADPAIKSALVAATQSWPNNDDLYECSTTDLRTAPESLSWLPESFRSMPKERVRPRSRGADTVSPPHP